MILPQYPTYFDSDTAEKQIEVTRDYLGKLKEALEVSMSHIKLSDMDEDTMEYFYNMNETITSLEKELADAGDRITSVYLLVGSTLDYAKEVESKVYAINQHALRNDNGESMSTYFAEKSIVFKNLNLGNQLSVEGNAFVDGQLSVGGNAFVDGQLQTDTALIDTQLQVSGRTYLDDQLSVEGNAFLKGQLQVSDLTYLKNKTYMADDAFLNKGNMYVYADKEDAGTPQESAKGGDIMALGVTIHEGEPTEEHIGGSVKAEKFRVFGLADNQYFRHMTMTVNGQLIHYLGIPDSEFQP